MVKLHNSTFMNIINLEAYDENRMAKESYINIIHVQVPPFFVISWIVVIKRFDI